MIIYEPTAIAVLVHPGKNGSDWEIDVLTTSHNGDNDAEVERIQNAHPGESECVIEGRVLGALAPTRCKVHYESCYVLLIRSHYRFRGHTVQAASSFHPPHSI